MSGLLAVLLLVVLFALLFGLLQATGSPGPATPVISRVRRPDDPTRETSARFMYTDAQGVTFACSLDDAPYVQCGEGIFGARTFPGPLPVGAHEFRVRAALGGRVSEAASYAWQILPAEGVKPAAPGSLGDGSDDATPSARTESEELPFEITGSISGLAPGLTKVIPLQLENPNDVPIEVTGVTVSIASDSEPAGCDSETNFIVHQATGITSTTPVTVPANDSVIVATAPQAPRITFLSLASNQDACKNKSFALTYSGSAHS